MFDNAVKMKNVFMEHGKPFAERTKEVTNVMSKAIMTDNITHDILQRDVIGQQPHETFVTERLVKGTKSVWAPMKKVKLNLFENSAMYSKTKVKEKIIELREERHLLARFVIIIRTCPDTDLKQAIGTCEFCAVSRSLCSPDGLLLAYDKFKVMHAIEELALNLSSGKVDDSSKCHISTFRRLPTDTNI